MHTMSCTHSTLTSLLECGGSCAELLAPDFYVTCSYCPDTHGAIAGAYIEPEKYGHLIYGVSCFATGISYGVTEFADGRIA